MPTATTEFRVRRGDLRRTEVAVTFPELAAGQARFRIDRFALTANNITYAAFGEIMNYWQFFPAPDGWGIVPVWGFATVVESLVPEIAAGARYYGYWPMASHAVLTPGRWRDGGFSDVAPHRSGLAAVYNGYATVATGDEARYALFRPLYILSFLVDDYLVEAVPDATRILVSSASSKTAIGLAQALKMRGGVETVGLTAPGNIGFVQSTGLYDRVLAYDALETLAAGTRTVFVDFAGNAATRARVHRHCGDALAASLLIGATDWDAAPAPPGAALPGPVPAMFFAPAVLAQRIAEWGRDGFEARLGTAWDSFVESTQGWLEVVTAGGPAAAEHHYRDLLEGRARPAQGIVLSLGEAA